MIDETRPRVSAFLSVYNGGDWLDEAIDSVMDQTEQNFEFVIVDDGSTDSTPDRLAAITDPRVVVFTKENGGQGAPLNPYLHKCRGEYIMRLDADDRCHPDRMRAQADFLDANPDVVMVGTQFRHFVDDSFGSPSHLPTGHDEILGGMRRGLHTMSHATTMWRTSVLEQTGGYRWTGAGEDWSLLLEAARYGRFANLDEPFYDVRLHRSSSSVSGTDAVIRGFAFARRRYEAYLAGEADYTLEDFERDQPHDAVTRARRFAKAKSVHLHRDSTVARFEGDTARWIALLGAAAVLDPRKSVGAVWKRIS